MTNPTFLPAGSIVPSGWIAAQARQNLDGYLGAMPNICPEVGSDVFAKGRLGRGSTAENVGDVQWWNGESEGNWLWAWAGHVRMVGTQEEIRAVDERFQAICRAGAADGYIGMFDADLRTTGALAGDAWTQSRVLGALAEWSRYRHDTELQAGWRRAVAELVQRLPRQLPEIFADPVKESLVRGHDLQIVDVLADAAAQGQDGASSLAQQVYKEFSEAELSWIEDDCQLDELGSDSDFHGHGPHVVENLRIPLRVAELVGDSAVRAAAAQGWRKLPRAQGVTGAIRSDEAVGVPDEPSRALPETGQEYCAITELALTALHYARALDAPGAADLVESLWLNSAQAARAKDGRGTAYFTAENQVAATAAMGPRWDVSPTHDDAAVCCVPNAGRILPMAVDASIVASDEGAELWLYGPVEARLEWNGTPVTVAQATQYPFEDQVRVAVAGAPDGFSLRLRRPGWLATLPVDAFPGATIVEDGWGVTISGPWPATADIAVDLSSEVRTLTAVDGRQALARGPLVYAVDIPAVMHETRHYPGTELADRDAIPSNPAQLFPPYLLEESAAAASIAAVDVPDDPWAQPPVALETVVVDPNPRAESLGGTGRRSISMVPIGSTTLRFTCLPLLPS